MGNISFLSIYTPKHGDLIVINGDLTPRPRHHILSCKLKDENCFNLFLADFTTIWCSFSSLYIISGMISD